MKVSSNKISDIYSYYINLLEAEYSRHEGGILLKRLMGYYLDIQSFKIPQHIENERVGESMMLKIHFGVKDLLQHKPLEYIMGRADFYEMKFEVNEDTLIPRPETEELVDMIWKASATLKRKPKILDIGTGSGCIGIALSKLIEANVLGIDVSEKALNIAKINAIKNNSEMKFLKVDFLDINQRNSLKETFDVIVSNPPYVRELEKSLLQPNVLDYEPHLALFVPDNNPLIFYEAIATFGKTNLNPNGSIFLEINEFLGKETAEIFKADYSEVKLIQDLNGKDRFLWVHV